MISFFTNPPGNYYIVQHTQSFQAADITKLSWLFGNGTLIEADALSGKFIGPRREMVTPWSTNAVEITQNMGIGDIQRIEELMPHSNGESYDPMLQAVYENPGQSVFDLHISPAPIKYIDDISAYNQQEGLALNAEEISYLEDVSRDLGRLLTDSEVFGFSQVNSEHCRHKIFNGTFIIDGHEKTDTLFQLIKKTSKQSPGRLVSAYKDNVAFIKGPRINQFAPETQNKPDYFVTKPFESVLSLKAETHNFPTTVEPFNGAATGSGGEIRDRMAGGKGSMPLAGTAVYMTSYPRLSADRPWEHNFKERKWLYQSPADILIKASNGASDYGNKFGQPLIAGSLVTFEHQEAGRSHGFDKVIMLAGGVGYGKLADSQKGKVEAGDKIVVLGGDNYRIGMGGGAVSSVDTGEFSNKIELNAVQRSNPEMQKRVANAVRAMAEMDTNLIVSIHDHGAGGHLNCLSELIEDAGGEIDIAKLPVGDPTLSEREIIGNESQERMGLVIKAKDVALLKEIAERERAPMYVVGEATGDHKFVFKGRQGQNPMDWHLSHMFGSSPKTILTDSRLNSQYAQIATDDSKIEEYLTAVLKLEGVACKDWLTNKVDRCVTGRVAKQQTTGEIQLPLNNVGVMALDFENNKGVATAIGHAPVVAMVDAEAGSRIAITEALANIVWAPIADGLSGVSLSANWMWPAKNNGENDRLYRAVAAVSDFACALGINIPTGKDSLSMTQKYPDGQQVLAPGTVIISAIGEVSDITRVVSPEVKQVPGSQLILLPLTDHSPALGGSALAQVLGKIGGKVPDVTNPEYLRTVFDTVQQLITNGHVYAGHDVSSGGLITTLLEMNFPNTTGGMAIQLAANNATITERLFDENPALVVQVMPSTLQVLSGEGIKFEEIGHITNDRHLSIQVGTSTYSFNIDHFRDIWFSTSYLLDKRQTKPSETEKRSINYKKQPLQYNFPSQFGGNLEHYKQEANEIRKLGLVAAIIREKGVNSDREMAYMLHLAGFKVKDVHMTDLINGREDLSGVQMIVFVGGFSNSDVLGSAKGWAGAFKYNDKARISLENFYARPDTLSLGVCNGCQLMMELGLVFPKMGDSHPRMHHNESGRFECQFTSVDILPNASVMLAGLAGSTLGIWSAHGEGKFLFNGDLSQYNIIGKYHYQEYPANPNGSQEAAAILTSEDGRHLAMMPHLERSMFPWNWGHYPHDRTSDQVTPWIEAFLNASRWLKKNRS